MRKVKNIVGIFLRKSMLDVSWEQAAKSRFHCPTAQSLQHNMVLALSKSVYKKTPNLIIYSSVSALRPIPKQCMKAT